MAAGMISTIVIQLQFLPNHALFNVRFNTSISTIDMRPQGNNKKVEGFED
jgi:hypothetical protein